MSQPTNQRNKHSSIRSTCKRYDNANTHTLVQINTHVRSLEATLIYVAMLKCRDANNQQHYKELAVAAAAIQQQQ